MIFILLILVTIVALYAYATRTFKYWEERGVKYVKPIPLFGTYFSIYVGKESPTQFVAEVYRSYPKEKIVGLFRSSEPELVIRDPEIIKHVLIKDFGSFYPRGFTPHKKYVEPMLQNLFFADGDLWRLLRQRMTPAFTSGKLKAMFPLIVEHAEKLQGRVLGAATTEQPLDARDLMARYTTDFIGACGFGLNSDSLNDEDSAFRKLGKQIFNATILDQIKIALLRAIPVMAKYIHMVKVKKQVVSLVKHILEERNYKYSGRNDFIDLMIECRLKGVITCNSIEKLNSNGVPEQAVLELTDELIAAQVYVFFAAGFETSSSATSFTLHQLAFHPEIQEKVQADIDRVLTKYSNVLSYDSVKEMTYLDWTFKESMRLFPSLGFLKRKSARSYTIPECNVQIDEGIGILIPIQAIHNDPQYFENPEKFDPERFSPENWRDENKHIYLPFGAGPRACIGERLGQMQSLAGLAAVLSKFTVEPAPTTLRYPQVDPTSNIVQSIKNGLPLHFRERKLKTV